MPNKPSEPVREKLYEEYEDSLFRLVMHDTAENEVNFFLIEKERLKNDPDFQPAKEELEKFSQQLDVHFKKKKAYAARQRIVKLLNRSAVAILVGIILLFTTVSSVEAVRIRVLNFFMDIRQEYTSFQLKENENDSTGGSPVVNWNKAYVPTYIPDGYELSNTFHSEFVKKLVFKDQQDSLIIYTELSEANSPGVDTEKASALKTISINGHKGTLVVKNSMVTIVWAIGNSMFTLQSGTSEETAIKIAEGVKYID